jgi:hypothetical protein
MGRGGAVPGQGGVGLGHMFIVRGGTGSPMIRSQSAPLPSLPSIKLSIPYSEYIIVVIIKKRVYYSSWITQLCYVAIDY